MAAFNKYQTFAQSLLDGLHALPAAGHTLKVMLSNTAPNAATHAVRADSTEISAGNGYTAGGIDIQNDVSKSGGIATLTGVDVVFTAAGGTIGPFTYAILYNDTPTSPADPLIGWWVLPATVTLQDTENFTVDFGASVLTVGP